MNNISDFTQCANCGACYNICPKDAIAVTKQDLFYSLQVDEEKCVHCGLCRTVCPVNTPQPKRKTGNAYAAIAHDEKMVKTSSSGGVFAVLARNILERDGVVFGAAYTQDQKEVILTSTQEVSLEQLQRSKYVESLPGLSFRQAKEALKAGKPVLFCAAPCQIAGLKRYLNKEYDQLITCDFSCGGMPSHTLYQQYLEGLERKLKAPIAEVNFRPKSYGWQNYAITVKAQNGKTYGKLSKSDPYFHCFLYGHTFCREYCYGCDFADGHYADLILADFWKYASISKVRNGEAGISLVVCNSEKGEHFLLSNSGQMALTVLDPEKGAYNIQPRTPNESRMEKRREFLQQCRELGFWKAMKPVRLSRLWKFRMKYRIKKWLGKLN